jgi:hypothetical protein
MGLSASGGGTNVTIISILGRKPKPDGRSEFSFYSFYGDWDTSEEHGQRLLFQEWLNTRQNGRSIQVFEHPTWDYGRIPKSTLEAISSNIVRLLSEGRTVVLMDSAADTLIRQVCKYL